MKRDVQPVTGPIHGVIAFWELLFDPALSPRGERWRQPQNRSDPVPWAMVHSGSRRVRYPAWVGLVRPPASARSIGKFRRGRSAQLYQGRKILICGPLASNETFRPLPAGERTGRGQTCAIGGQRSELFGNGVMLNPRTPPWRRNSSRMASDKSGAVHFIFSIRINRPGSGRCAAVLRRW